MKMKTGEVVKTIGGCILPNKVVLHELEVVEGTDAVRKGTVYSLMEEELIRNLA